MKNLAIGLIKIYQLTELMKQSILYSVFGVVSGCKHSPTCSQYTILQIRKHGTITGLRRGLWRLANCR